MLSMFPTTNESMFGRSKLQKKQGYCNFKNVLSFPFWNSIPVNQPPSVPASFDLTTGRTLTVYRFQYVTFVFAWIHCLYLSLLVRTEYAATVSSHINQIDWFLYLITILQLFHTKLKFNGNSLSFTNTHTYTNWLSVMNINWTCTATTGRELRCLGGKWERWEQPELGVKHFRRYVAIINLRQRKDTPRIYDWIISRRQTNRRRRHSEHTKIRMNRRPKSKV
jgi:hypothetical protein